MFLCKPGIILLVNYPSNVLYENIPLALALEENPMVKGSIMTFKDLQR